MFSLYVKFALRPDTTYNVDAEREESVKALCTKAAEALEVESSNIELWYENSILDPEVTVEAAGLAEGSVVEAKPNKRFQAKLRLEELGLECTGTCLRTRVLQSDAVAATEEEKVELTRCFLAAGDAFLFNAEAIGAAASAGLVEVVKLLANPMHLNRGDPYFGSTPLHTAAREGHLNVVRELITLGSNINKLSREKCTPLHSAVGERSANNLLVVRELLERGADIDVPDKYGSTALHDAVECGLVDIVKELLAHKADTTVTDKQGRTPAVLAQEYAAERGDENAAYKEVAALLATE